MFVLPFASASPAGEVVLASFEAAFALGLIDAEIDIPSLSDSEKIGRRAALAIILSHEPSGIVDLEGTLQTGPQVRALVTAAVYAFAGLARIDETLKSPASRMDAIPSRSSLTATPMSCPATYQLRS